MAHLNCYSFHSVKGGVGKSTLSTFLAYELARTSSIWLIDMDLTGTSLGDVLPLMAPSWVGGFDLLSPPNGFLSRTQTLEAMARRDAEPPGWTARDVPFLNDFLMYSPTSEESDQDVHPEALGWRLERGADKLRVVPSSALPRDLALSLPVIYDEDQAPFLEGRLELLIDALINHGVENLVFDTPPTIPGLSRAILSLALRLGHPVAGDKIPLGDDGFIPSTLKRTSITWTAFVVCSLDPQDLRATDRWLRRILLQEEDLFRLVINRVPPGDPMEWLARLGQEAVGSDPLLSGDPLNDTAEPSAPRARLVLPTLTRWLPRVIPVEDHADLQFFRQEALPSSLQTIADLLLGNPMRHP